MRSMGSGVRLQHSLVSCQLSFLKICSRTLFVALGVAFLVHGTSVAAEKAYPEGCSGKPLSYYDYDNWPFPPGGVKLKSTFDYRLLRRLGSGKFSDVFEAVDVQLERKLQPLSNANVDPRTLVVLKVLKPVSDRKIKRELLVLQHCSEIPNLVKLVGLVLQPRNIMPTFVLQHAGMCSQWLCHGRGVDPTNMSETAKDKEAFLTEYDIQYYLYHLLVALDSLHAAGIMHRDVKPRNILINKLRGQQPLMLVDLGLAEMYIPETRYNVRVASRHFKGPELLVGYAYYDYAIDMWGVGCILAGLLFRKEPFFRGRDNYNQLGKIISVLGTQDLISYMTKYKIDLTPELRQVIAKYVMRGSQKKVWTDMIKDGCPRPSPEALDLLEKLLVYDHVERWSARQALEHPFFDHVRSRVESEIVRLFPDVPLRRVATRKQQLQ
jgi:casein kinase II subunit alpha